MKLHNYCIRQDGKRGKRSWFGVDNSLSPSERTELDVDRTCFVREMRALNRNALVRCRDAVGGRGSVALRTRITIPSRKREVLKNIVKEKGLTRPLFASAN